MRTKIFYILLFIFLLILPPLYFIQSPSWFEKQFENKNIYAKFTDEYSKEAIDQNFSEVMDYMNSKSNSYNRAFFSREDNIHINDVRNLIRSYYITLVFLLISLTSIFIYSIKSELFNTNLIKRFSLVSIGILISSLIIIYIAFSEAFDIFHELFFRNDYWLLDPTTSNLIKYFPESFFIEIVVITLCFNIFIHISILIYSYIKSDAFDIINNRYGR
jgi:integral membrane protein (TIGR01906 family)